MKKPSQRLKRRCRPNQPVILDELTPSNVVNPVLLRRGIASMAGVPLVVEGDQGNQKSWV